MLPPHAPQSLEPLAPAVRRNVGPRPRDGRRRWLRTCALAPFAVASGACATAGAPEASARTGDAALPGTAGRGDDGASARRLADVDARVLAALRGADVALLGEVHDNTSQHAMRARWLDRLTRERPTAIAFEQLDADRQPDIDRARAAGVDARALAERAGFDFRGWDWDAYAPYLKLALSRGLPIVAANLSSAEVRRIARGGDAGLAAPPSAWNGDDERALRREIVDGHCGLLPPAAVPAMAAAQRARDRRMAQAIADARRRDRLPVVLLAGNGHTRADHGVPRYLHDLAPGDRIVAIGLLERPLDEGTSAWDLVVPTVRQPREDPCAALRERGGVGR